MGEDHSRNIELDLTLGEFTYLKGLIRKEYCTELDIFRLWSTERDIGYAAIHTAYNRGRIAGYFVLVIAPVSKIDINKKDFSPATEYKFRAYIFSTNSSKRQEVMGKLEGFVEDSKSVSSRTVK